MSLNQTKPNQTRPNQTYTHIVYIYIYRERGTDREKESVCVFLIWYVNKKN